MGKRKPPSIIPPADRAAEAARLIAANVEPHVRVAVLLLDVNDDPDRQSVQVHVGLSSPAEPALYAGALLSAARRLTHPAGVTEVHHE